MAIDVAAKRYARAAFELAVESGDLVAWSAAVERLAEFLRQPEHALLLENTRVPAEAKHRLVDAGLNDLPRLAQNLAHVLVRKGRTALAAQIFAHFRDQVEEHQGVLRARATTAVPLGEAQSRALAGRLQDATGKRVRLESEVDATILGGVVVQIGDRLFDGSTRSRLRALRAGLVGPIS